MKFRNVLIAILLFLSSIQIAIAASQNSSRQQVIQLEGEIRQHIALADSFHLISTDSVKTHAFKASELSLEIGNPHLKAISALRLAYGLIYGGNLDSALNLFNSSRDQFEKDGNILLLARADNGLGMTYYQLGDYRSAMDYYLSALATFEKENDKDGQAAVNVNLSGIYNMLGEYELDLNSSKKAAKLYKSMGDMKQYAICLNNIGDTYNHMGEYHMAIKYLKKSIEIKEKQGVTSSMAYSYATLYESYAKKRDFQSGKKYLDLAFDIFTKSGNIGGLILTNQMLASYYSNFKNFDKSVDHALVAYMLAKQSGHSKEEMELCSDLATYYIATAKEMKARDFEKRYLKMKDSLLSKAVSEEVMNAQVTYELNKKKFSLDRSEIKEPYSLTEISRSNALIHYVSIIVIGILAMVQVIAMGYYWSQRRRTRVQNR